MMCAILSGERLCDASKGVISSARVCVPGTRSVYGMPSMGQKIKTYQLKTHLGERCIEPTKRHKQSPSGAKDVSYCLSGNLG